LSAGQGGIVLVLHTHLPWVLHHGRTPHGTDWICEAAVTSYARILEAFERLASEGVRVRATVSVTPVLAEQLAHPAFEEELGRFLERRVRSAAEDGEAFASRGERAISGIAGAWRTFFEEAGRSLAKGAGRILERLRTLASEGTVELVTSAATHGYLPLLGRDESVELQIAQAVRTHRRRFDRSPRGFWLPECAYRPAYVWTRPAGVGPPANPRRRPSLGEALVRHEVSYFFADAHLLAAGEPLSLYHELFPNLGRLRGEAERIPAPRGSRSPYSPYAMRVGSSGAKLAVLARDPRTTNQVWSRSKGYPGDGAYLDFHKRHESSGHRYWSVTSPSVALESKALYDLPRARERAEEHARHFVWLLGQTIREARDPTPVVNALFDTELFGHWWFEGPWFLEHVFRNLVAAGIDCWTASEALERRPPSEEIQVTEGSWGEGGDHRLWLNDETRWIWDRIYDAEEEIARLATSLGVFAAAEPQRLLRLAARELLVLQSSDWPFLITSGTARDYAERRFAVHYADLKRLADLARREAGGDSMTAAERAFAEAVALRDDLFEDLDPTPFVAGGRA
jgi:1,4-alpha-glucan branching enzyme